MRIKGYRWSGMERSRLIREFILCFLSSLELQCDATMKMQNRHLWYNKITTLFVAGSEEKVAENNAFKNNETWNMIAMCDGDRFCGPIIWKACEIDISFCQARGWRHDQNYLFDRCGADVLTPCFAVRGWQVGKYVIFHSASVNDSKKNDM